MAAILKNPIGPPLAISVVIHISELGYFVPKTPEMWSCLLLYDFVGQNCKNVFYDGGHFESTNMATPLKIGFGSRQI